MHKSKRKLKSENENFFKEQATVLHLGTDMQAMQWKEATGKILKTTTAMHFSIKKCKRFFIKKKQTKDKRRGAYRRKLPQPSGRF